MGVCDVVDVDEVIFELANSLGVRVERANADEVMDARSCGISYDGREMAKIDALHIQYV